MTAAANSHERTLSMILETMLCSYRGWRSCGMGHDAAVDKVLSSSCAGQRAKECFRTASNELSWSL